MNSIIATIENESGVLTSYLNRFRDMGYIVRPMQFFLLSYPESDSEEIIRFLGKKPLIDYDKLKFLRMLIDRNILKIAVEKCNTGFYVFHLCRIEDKKDDKGQDLW
jgi:hypothetical protein